MARRLLAVVAALLATLAVNRSDLTGKKIVAYDHGYLNWLKPEYDSPIDGRFGMLPVFVESLGGQFQHSKDLAEADLAGADVLLLIHPDQPWPQETLDRVWDYVRRGGSLLLVAEPAIREGNSSSSFNDVLAPLAMEVRFDTAVPRVCNWEQSYEVMAHPATTGIGDLRNRFGIQLGSSIRTSWPARPALVGRWGWSDPGNDAVSTGGSSYTAGDRLGDLVLAAEQTVGQGRVFVLGDTSPLQNDGLPAAYPFTGRLLAYLADRPSSPQAGWRQWLTLATLLTMLGLLAARPAAWQTMLTPTVLGVSLVCCVAAGHSIGAACCPTDVRSSPRGNIAYIDASHLDAYQSDSQIERGVNHGIAEFERTLMRQGYLPLLAPDVTAGTAGSLRTVRLDRAGTASFPRRSATPCSSSSAAAERSCAWPAPRTRGQSRRCWPTSISPFRTRRFRREMTRMSQPPLAPKSREPAEATCSTASTRRGRLSATQEGADKLSVWTDGKDEQSIIVGRKLEGGSIVVIGDTHFAGNQNFQVERRTVARQNPLLAMVVQSRDSRREAVGSARRQCPVVERFERTEQRNRKMRQRVCTETYVVKNSRGPTPRGNSRGPTPRGNSRGPTAAEWARD